MLVMSITLLVSNTFWSIFVTEKLQISTQSLAIFPFIKSAIMLIFYFTVMPTIAKMHFKLPLLVGFLGYVASHFVLVTSPGGSYGFLIFSVFLEACSMAVVSPLVDQMVVLTVDAKERARIQSILYVIVILLTSPFGWIAGNLSAMNKNLPFYLNLSLFIIGTILAYFAGQAAQDKEVMEAAIG
jgi:Na+/melibiose symporter-like transporter